MFSRWRRWVVILVAIYLLICGGMFVFQERLLFHPRAIPSEDLRRLRELTEEITVSSDGATLRGFFVSARRRGKRPTVLYFGGNAERVARRALFAGFLQRGGFHAAFVDYRGFGSSSGSPSADGLRADGLAIYDAIAARDDVDPHRVMTWGLSLGTGIAVHVARHRAVAGVVLLAPYDRLSRVAGGHYPWLPVSLLLRHEIDAAEDAGRIEAPALMFHGSADRVIPIARGEGLRDAWKGKVRWISVPGAGHDDLETPRFERELVAFLKDL